MARPSKSIIEQAIVEAAQAEYQRVTSGLGEAQRTQLVEYALDELAKLRGDRHLPNYHAAVVALFYTLWYLPSQVNLACSLVEDLLPDNGDVHIIDFGAGPGSLCLGVAMAVARRRRTKLESRVIVHEIDCEAMRLLSNSIWHRFLKIADSDGNLGCQRAAHMVEKRNYANPDDIVDAFERSVPQGTARSLTALHVIYDDNQQEVKDMLAKLWKQTQPSWAFVTTPNVGSKPVIAREIVPFRPTQPATLELSVTGKCSRLTELRQEIRNQFPFAWPKGPLLWSDVTWDFDESRRPYVLRYPGEIGGSP